MTEKCTAQVWPALGARCCLDDGHEGPHQFKCAGPSCPGLGYPASYIPHPYTCTKPRPDSRLADPDWIPSRAYREDRDPEPKPEPDLHVSADGPPVGQPVDPSDARRINEALSRRLSAAVRSVLPAILEELVSEAVALGVLPNDGGHAEYTLLAGAQADSRGIEISIGGRLDRPRLRPSIGLPKDTN